MSYSRFSDDYEESMPYELWRANVHRAIVGKRGQRMLRELLAVLEALPEKRLIRGEIIAPTWGDDGEIAGGEVCAIGALALHRAVQAGESVPSAVEDLIGNYGETNEFETAMLGEKLGMSYTLAWEVAQRNDEYETEATPEERYARMLDWTRKQLLPVPA